MPLSEVAVSESIKASTQNKLIKNANGSPGRAIFTANGSWSVPQGVFSFKVYLAGGGGGGASAYGDGSEGFTFIAEGGRGGDGTMCSKIFTGVAEGTAYLIEIGAGGTGASGGFFGDAATAGGTSKFGTVLQSAGGQPAPVATSPYQIRGANGAHNGQIAHDSRIFLRTQDNGYGEGGRGGGYSSINGANGNPGICVIEW